MILINKKRIGLVLACVLIGLFTFTFQIASKEKNVIKNAVSMQTTAIPTSGKVIVVDAGHGVPDERSGKFIWYNRGTNKFGYSIKTSKVIRTNGKYSNTYAFR